jgi:hypothetical protein
VEVADGVDQQAPFTLSAPWLDATRMSRSSLNFVPRCGTSRANTAGRNVNLEGGVRRAEGTARPQRSARMPSSAS